MTIRQAAILVGHALVGWALCTATIAIGMATTSVDTTLIIHALLTPLFFVLVSLSYFTRFTDASPVRTALLFVGIVMAIDFLVVALLVLRSLAMFASPLGTWLPFDLIFTATYLTGRSVTRRPLRPPGVAPAARG
jgi:hypothetical protein